MAAESFPVLHVRGSHYEVGHSLGRTFKQFIQNYINKSDLLQNSLLPFYDSRAGRDVVDNVLAITEKNFPEYVDEIRGMAQGAELPFETMFLNSMQMDIYFGFMKQTTKYSPEDIGCSTVFLNSPDVKVIGHNEDGEDLVKTHGYFLDATIVDGNREIEKFTSLIYPGCLPGNAISFNKNGLVFTINALPSLKVETTTPVDFITRAMLRAKDFNEVKEIVANSGFGVSSGVSINVGSIHDTSTQWSIEVVSGLQKSKVYVKEIRESENLVNSTYVHLNEYRHADIQIESGCSSPHRMTSISQHPLPTCAKDVRGILGDVSNEKYPVYRTPRTTDDACTVCTGMFDLVNKTLDVYFDNPSKNVQPLLSFTIS